MTTWYAQNSSVDINSANEWNDAADGSGNWLTWASLGDTDILCANGKTAIAINVDVPTCVRLSTAAEGTGAAGGGFTLTMAASARTIAAAILAGTTPCVVVSNATNRLTVTGKITGGDSAAAYGVSFGSQAPKIDVVGNYETKGGTNATAYAVHSMGGTGNPTFGGPVTAATSPAVYVDTTSAETISVSGTLTSTTVPAVVANGAATLILSGSTVISSSWIMPFQRIGATQKIKWDAPDGGVVTMYDSDGDPHSLKVPDYPAEAKVESGTKYDYNAKTGTLAAGYTYGDESQAKVLTTAAGAGTYQPVAAADVRSGTAVGVSPAVGTLDLPAVADVKDGVLFDGDTKEGEYPTTAATQAADAAILEAEKAFLLATKTITFGASNVIGTLAVANVLEAVTGGTYHAPAAAEVISSAVFGPASGTAGTYDVTNVSAGNIKDGVSIGGVAGTYDPMAAAVFPAEADVNSADVAYGPTGAEYAGALDMSLYTLISGVVAAANVRKGVDRYTGGDAGTLVGCVDKNGTNQGASGILDSASTFEDCGTLSAAHVYHSSGIIDSDGTFWQYGVFDAWGAYYATGVIDGDGDHYDLTYAHTTAGGSLTFPGGADVQADAAAYGIAGSSETPSYPTTATSQAAQKATDAAFLETNKAEIIPTDTAILAEFSVTGTAEVGGTVIVIED